ncbi:hypothetical protein [Streptomyces viridosporus]|uniref:hypothetical protein n=1 Tax=Streptomyces viridosporus TaxID=67581 RepID=UPI00332E56E4
MGRKGAFKGTPRREAYLVLRRMFNMSPERLFQHVDPGALAPATVSTGTAGLAPTLASFGDPLAIVAQTHRLTSTNADTPVLTMVTQ